MVSDHDFETAGLDVAEEDLVERHSVEEACQCTLRTLMCFEI